MQKVIRKWEECSQATQTTNTTSVHLTARDRARVRALSELYPGFSEERIITDLLNAALDEVEEALPYIQGDKVVMEDEYGDPVYEDIGKTAEFARLTNKYTALLEEEEKIK